MQSVVLSRSSRFRTFPKKLVGKSVLNSTCARAPSRGNDVTTCPTKPQIYAHSAFIIGEKMKRKQVILIALLVISLLVIPSVFSKPENNPFNELWEAVTNLRDRVTTLEQSPSSGTVLKFYEVSQPDEIELPDPPGEGAMYQFAVLTITPSNPNNYVWKLKAEWENIVIVDYGYDTILEILVENENGDYIGYNARTLYNSEEWEQEQLKIEPDPFFTSRINEQIVIKFIIQYYNPIQFRNIKINLMVFEGIQ